MQAWKFNFCIDRIKMGDTKWLAEIYDEYYQKMIFTAWSIVRNIQIAEDIASDFIKYILQNANKIGPVEYPDAWVSAAIHNNSVNYIRKNNKTDYIDDLEEDCFAHQVNYDLYCALKAEFKNLSEYEEQLVILRFFSGLRLNVISSRLEKPMGTIKSDISKIKNKLKYLKKYI